ncbi:MAG: S8 family peptidase [Bacteriovoracaceae bacterium]
MKLTTGILVGLFALSAAATEGRFHPNHLFIKMKEGQSLVKSPLIKSAEQVFGDLYLVKTSNAVALEASLKGQDAIAYTEKDFYGEKEAMPSLQPMDAISFKMKSLIDTHFANFNDPEANKLWAFNGASGMDVEGAYRALPNRAANEVIVAVVDTGVDHNHEDLKDIMWENRGEIPGDGKDNDGNGYIDDIHGINVLVRDAQGHATMDTMGSHWHGTHVSGTIAATQNNGIGIAGVASNVKIMAIRTVPDDADELNSDIVEAYKYAAKNGAKIINCSFGKAPMEGDNVVRDVINEIGKKYGVLVIASAGNDSWGPMAWHDNDADPKIPAALDSANLLTIASTTNSGALSSFSNIGAKTVDVAAPGSDIYSTIIGNKYAMASGTSMASPNTTGVAAMVLGYYPNLKGEALKNVLIQSVVKVPAFAGKMVSGGRVNLKQALAAAAKTARRK